MALENKIADRVNMDLVVFETKKRWGKSQRAVVSFSTSTKTLYFNNKMLNVLNMEKWKQVVVGYDAKSKIIVLKECEPEEYGAVALRKKQNKGSNKIGKILYIGHIIDSLKLFDSCLFRAEKEGCMIFLELA